MRKKNTIKNIKYNLIFTIVLLIINFLSRSVFIENLGGDIAGFNTLILNLMAFLNIAELGVAVAITYALYEPLNNKDYKKINDIMSLFKNFYIKIALIIFILGIILGFLLNIFVKNQIPMNQAYLYYMMFLINVIIGYFFVYKQTLIVADQKQYIVVYVTNSIKILKIIMQIIILKITQNYFIWILLELVFNIINLLILNYKANKLYYQIDFKSKKNIRDIKSENFNILKSIKEIFYHKIASFIVYQTDGILIAIFLNLKDIAIYGNYIMIINGVLGIINSITGSVTASIGNLVSEKNNKKSFDIFEKLYMIDHFIAIIVTFTLYNIIDLFIIIWVGNEYVLNKSIIFVLMINVYIQISRGTIENFKTSYGLFWDVWAPVVEGAINLIVSYLLVRKMGIIGLFIGTVISNIVIVILWKPYMLYIYGFKKNIKKHIVLFIKMMSMMSLNMILANKVKEIIFNIFKLDVDNMIGFSIYSLMIFIIISLITFISFISNKKFRDLVCNILSIKNVN